MFTLAEVMEAQELAQKLYPLQKKLDDYCDEVAKHLDFNNASQAYMTHDGHVHFKAEWFGPYQSHNTEWFDFPIDNLYQTSLYTAQQIIKAKRPWLKD